MGAILGILARLLPWIIAGGSFLKTYLPKIIVGAFLIYLIVNIETALDGLIDYMDDFTALMQGPVSSNLLNVANRVFPVNELLAIVSGLFGLFLICIGIRWFKALMDTSK